MTLRPASIVLIGFFICLSAPQAIAQLALNGKSLTVTTSNSVVTFSGADLVGFQNVLTGETYLTNPSGGELASVNPMQSSGQTLQTSNWVAGNEGGVPTASITVSDSARTLTLTVKIDATSQEAVVKSAATVSTPGLRDASWSIAGLNLSSGRLIVPSDSGVVFDAAHPPVGQFFQYLNNWHAQMIVYEAAMGSFVLYSTDQQYRFKDLRSTTRGGLTVDLAFVTEATAPFTTATSAPTIEWRLKALSGNWRTAAQIYRNWLSANRPPVSNSAHPWVDGIRTVVGVRALDENILAPLATQLVPSTTLLYVHDWRLSPYDNNYPDYTPRSGVLSFINAAHALGFKVMLHFDLIGASPGNPDFSSVQAYQAKTPDTLQLKGWQWDLPPSTPTRFAIINPASSVFRSLFVSRVAAAVNAVHPDALHMDFSGSMSNDGNGLIEGLTYAQGSAQLHQDLIAAFPSLAIGGEGENDVLYRYQSFAQSWILPTAVDQPGHPIVDFLFSSPVQFYGHLGQPVATDPSFKKFLSNLEHRAMLACLAVWSVNDLDTTKPDNARLIGLLQNWQDHAFQPDWNSNWNGALVRYAGTGSTNAVLTDSGTLETLTGAGSTLYQLAHNANQVSTTSFIPAWPAFDSSTLYGLDPAQLYWLDSAARPASTHVTALPAGYRIGTNTLVSAKFISVEVAKVDTSVFDFMQNLFTAGTGIMFQGSDWPLANGAEVYRTNAAVGGVTRDAILIRPPWQGQFGGETFVQYSLPILSNAQLQFSVGIRDGATCNVDGVTFRVTVNGTELYRQNYPLGAWHDGSVNLAAYANSTITLRIVSNPGPQSNTACDPGSWSRLNIVYPSNPVSLSVPISLASGSTISGFDGDGSLSQTSSLSASVSNLPIPGRFIILTLPGSDVSSGTNLANLPFEIWNGPDGNFLRPGAVFDGVGSVGGAISGGVTKNPGIFAHPPDGGQTVLSWTLNIPQATSLHLGWSAGILDGASSYDGVDFSLRINGITYWQLTKQDDTWTPGSGLELQQWRGKNILLELVTNDRSNSNYDWADWADLILGPNSVTCSYGLPAAITVGAQGAQLSLSVTPQGTCPWAASSKASWVTVVSGASGVGSGTIYYTVAPNPSGPRSGILVVAGQTVRINQADANGLLPRIRGGQITSQ